MPDDDGLLTLEEIPGAILRIHDLECRVTEGDLWDDLIYMRMRVDSLASVPFPLTAEGIALLEKLPLGAAVGSMTSSSLTHWKMEGGESQSVGFAIPFLKQVTFEVFDHDGGFPGDGDDPLGSATVRAHQTGPNALEFTEDDAHYILHTEVVSPTDAAEHELLMLLRALGIDPKRLIGCPDEPPTPPDDPIARAIERALGIADGVAKATQPLKRPPVYAGVWRASAEGERLIDGLDFTGFSAKVKQLSGKGMRLVGVEPYVAGEQRRWTGVFAPGEGAHAFYVSDLKGFLAKHDELVKAGLRLVDMETYLDDDRRWWAGVWRSGADGHALLVGLQWDAFVKEVGVLHAKGVRLTGLQTYMEGNRRLWAGFFRGGTGGHALWCGNWDGFVKVWGDLAAKGLRLVDLATFKEGGHRRWAGAWRAGNDPHVLLAGLSEADFEARHAALRKDGLRLVDVEIYQPA